MTWSAVRLATARVGPKVMFAARNPIPLINSGGHLGLTFPTLQFQVAWISGKQIRSPDYKRPAPWPYKEKKYRWYHGLLDDTLSRFDENTKIVVVEGNIAAGKTKFAEELAEQLDMHFVPEANMDMVYVNDYGFDMRTLDPQLPASCRSCDVKTFYQNPSNENISGFQFEMYKLRYEQYIDALAHILHTGQGIVMDRSVYSDFVFLETMVKFGYISKPARNLYYEVKNNTIGELLQPHLVIYLDVPVDILMERINKRNVPYEINSKVLTKEYLETLEYYYKQQFLKQISKHAELLIYDWSNYGDVEVVVEDIERVDFDRFEKHDPKLKDWRIYETDEWNGLRYTFSNRKYKLMSLLNIPNLDVPELLISAQDYKTYIDVMRNAPGNKYVKGFNKDMGDKGILFKMFINYRDNQKFTIP
ncbi:NADH dehydrogenase [ubiquinone] 1 alpha subcomplex subunit 10, mitochondrial-like [Tachypleus tridentatus]|uniref:NADH dehydrogenase [ubiquinone] 1 alpha subcomplex subunit 10, mitochondrial-like n=1 Tax=Tachypleus tridentatus TaxID=6853 RepID=UPI003FCF06A9